MYNQNQRQQAGSQYGSSQYNLKYTNESITRNIQNSTGPQLYNAAVQYALNNILRASALQGGSVTSTGPVQFRQQG